MPSLSNSNAGPMSEKTWAQAKREVAQVVGGQDDPDTLVAAGAQIQAVLEDWNTRRNWQFLQTQAPDITVTAGTSIYDLPAPFKKPYSAILDTTILSYTTRRQYNRTDTTQAASVPDSYTLFNYAENGKIELIPPVGINGTLKVWYYRRMVETDDDNATLDILGRYTNYVLDAARARLLAIKGPVDKLSYWAQMGEAGFAKAQADDEQIPDEDLGFAPMHAFLSVPPDNSFKWVDWGW